MSGVYLIYELATPATPTITPEQYNQLLASFNLGGWLIPMGGGGGGAFADAQIDSGKYFIVGGNLYKSTTTIPAGDAINPGSNCILTNLADALNALNT